MDRVIRRRFAVASSATLAVLVLASCGGSAGSGAQPESNGFGPGAFADLPKPGGQQSFGPPTKDHGTWVQSFDIDGLSPAETMQFYATALGSDWTKTSGPTTLGHCRAASSDQGNGCTYREVWSNSPTQLEIVAGPAGANENQIDGGTELSLLLTGGG